MVGSTSRRPCTRTPGSGQEQKRQVRLWPCPLPRCVTWDKPDHLSESAAPARKLHALGCSGPQLLWTHHSGAPHRGAAWPSCLLEVPLEAGRQKPWPLLLPTSFLSHFSSSGLALRVPEATTSKGLPRSTLSLRDPEVSDVLGIPLAPWDKPFPGESLET